MGSSGSSNANPNTTSNNANKPNTQKTVNNQNAQNTQKSVKGGQKAVASNENTSKKQQDTRGKVSKQDPSQQQQQQNKGKSVTGKTSTQRETIKEKGYKKRIRERLRNASAGNDLDELEHIVEIFETNRMVDGGDLTEAKEKMNYLQLRKHIRDAIMRRHPTILDEAIADVENSQYGADLQSFVVKAKQVKAELAELDK